MSTIKQTPWVVQMWSRLITGAWIDMSVPLTKEDAATNLAHRTFTYPACQYRLYNTQTGEII